MNYFSPEPLLLNSNNCVLSNYTLNQQLNLAYGNKFAFSLLEHRSNNLGQYIGLEELVQIEQFSSTLLLIKQLSALNA